MIEKILVQGIGVIAYLILMYSYHRKKKAEILALQIISFAFFALHYYLLNGITGAICNIIAAVMMVIIYLYDKKERKNKKVLIGIIIPVLIAISLISWENIFSIFPILASVLALIGFLFDSENIIRGIGITTAICWLIYGIIYLSYSAIFFEVITIITTIIAILKNCKRTEQKYK